MISACRQLPAIGARVAIVNIDERHQEEAHQLDLGQDQSPAWTDALARGKDPADDLQLVPLDRRIDLRFKDRMMHVRVGFDLSPNNGGTRVRHYVEIEPQAFIFKLMGPLIRRGVAKDTAEDVAKLKRVLETGP